MKRVSLTWRVDPAHWDEYKEIHLNPWPELIEAIQAVGIHNYSIFAMGTRMFAYLEVDGNDVYQALGRLGETEVMKKWNEEVGAWVLPEAEEGSGIQFMELDHIFYCQ